MQDEALFHIEGDEMFRLSFIRVISDIVRK